MFQLLAQSGILIRPHVAQPGVYFTRTADPDSCRNVSCFASAFMHVNGQSPVEVVPSPFGDPGWVTRDELVTITRKAIQVRRFPFLTLNGSSLVLTPFPGQPAWFEDPFHPGHRIRHVYKNGEWVVDKHQELSLKDRGN